MKREHKYLVVKMDDIHKYLTLDEQEDLNKFLEKVQAGRESEGKSRFNRYVVVNEDEDYSEVVWKLIEVFEDRKEKDKDKSIWYRASGDVECSECKRPYRDHLGLHMLCNGDLVKT